MESEFIRTIMMDESHIEGLDSTKFLGMHLGKVTSGIYVLRDPPNYCFPELLGIVYYGLISTPRLSYGVRLWGACAKYKIREAI